jgi:hypothetical protein
MANFIYDKAREKFLNADIDWLTDTIKAVLVDTAAYSPAPTTHEFLSDIPVGDRIATSAALTGKTSNAPTGGVADADNVTWPTVTGDPSEALVLIKDTGSAATSPLIAYIDRATGLPVTPNGGDITVTWDNGSNRIFKL